MTSISAEPGDRERDIVRFAEDAATGVVKAVAKLRLKRMSFPGPWTCTDVGAGNFEVRHRDSVNVKGTDVDVTVVVATRYQRAWLVAVELNVGVRRRPVRTRADWVAAAADSPLTLSGRPQDR